MSNSKELSSDILRKLYYGNHQYCPNCGSKNLTKTLAAYIFDASKPNDFKDLNSAKCNTCGWGGTVHDLVGEQASANTPKVNTVMKSKRCTNCKHFEKTNVKNCGICTCSERKHPLVGHSRPTRYNIVGCTGGRTCEHYVEK